MSNILVTGAAGFIGGSIVADFLASKSTLMQKANIFAAVRSTDQAEALTRSGVEVVQLDLSDQQAVIESVLQRNINIIIHTSSSINSELAINLITALGKQKEISGETTHFIHTSGDSAFYETSGWPHGKIKDTDDIFDLEKQSAHTFPIRKTDVDVIQVAESKGVRSFIVFPTMVFGKGTGAWNQLSVLLPVVVRASISRKSVSRFAQETTISAVHISDLTGFYERIVSKILLGENIPSGVQGYYFAQAFDVSWWEILDHLTTVLHSRGVVADAQPQIWRSHEDAAAGLDIPVEFVKILWNSNANIIGEKKKFLGWTPDYDKARLLHGMDAEVDAVLELGEAKSSLIESLHKAAAVQ
ncbi:hypothetical protein BDV96DRAFT_650649 [Lophiotrema nucula]|uniref:NmrA-like domain-containing protein n=1 Tax=Lophiotrema nucula TaxID=690887 RepID=A0A6A5YWV2_9PLEO|nr:hypothetical protein BDV96DRAFT_650649 [Lophiotrema nucula]